MSKKLIVVMLSLLACISQICVAQDEWNLRKDDEGIQVYTRKVAGSPYDAVKATMVVENARLSAMVALVEDTDACADWVDRCDDSYLFERISDTEAYIYTHTNLPFPVKDRDMLAHLKWSQDSDTLEVTMESEATTGKLDPVRGRVRLVDGEVSWHFKPLGSGRIEVTNRAHIDPNGSIPGWLVNLLLIDTPFETLKSFAAEISKPKYYGANISFIEEPTN